MIYTQRLPKLNQFERLCSQIKNFPITGQGIVQYAEHLGYDEEIISFLQRFTGQVVFKSRSEFLNRVRLLERLIKEENNQPNEFLFEAEED